MVPIGLGSKKNAVTSLTGKVLPLFKVSQAVYTFYGNCTYNVSMCTYVHACIYDMLSMFKLMCSSCKRIRHNISLIPGPFCKYMEKGHVHTYVNNTGNLDSTIKYVVYCTVLRL